MYPALTPKDALEQFCLLTKLHSSQARLWLSKQDRFVWLCRQGIKSIGIGQQGVECYTLMLMLNLVRWSIRVAEWHPNIRKMKMSKYSISKEAIHDLDEISDYLARGSIEASERFRQLGV